MDDLRGTVTDDSQTTDGQAEDGFSNERNMPSVVLVILPEQNEQKLNKLLYQVALFNFSQFLIRDFELRPMPIFGTCAALRINGFDSMDEAEWYIGLMQNNTELKIELNSLNITDILPVTEENMKLINVKYTLDDYKAFIK